MTSTYSSSLRLELMATGDQSGTWGDTTNTNLGTLLEQAITGYLSVAQGDVANLTLTTVNGGSDQNRNAIINVTGALTANRNVVVQTANKLYLVKNATTGGYSIVVKTASGTGVTIVNGASRWVYSDGTNVVDGQFGPLLPSSNDGGALGAVGTAWSDLYGATGFTFNLNNDWIATHSAAVLTVGTGDLRVTTAGTNAASVATVGGTQTLTNKTMTSPVLNTPTVGTSLLPTTDDGAPLGSTSKEWSDLFLASGGVINWAAGDVTITHSTNALAFAGASSGYSFDAPVTTPGLIVSGNGTEVAGAITSNSFWGMYFRSKQASPLAGQFAWFNSAGTELIRMTDSVLHPSTNDGYSLGQAINQWSDLFLASGAVINFSNGDYTLTHSAGALTASGAFKSTSATGGIGYATGAGGTVTQASNKSTGVTLNTVSGRITMNAAALAAATIVSFVLTDSAIAATDVLILNHVSGGTPGSYTLNAQCAAGSATINVRNNTAGSLSEAIVIAFVVIKGVTS